MLGSDRRPPTEQPQVSVGPPEHMASPTTEPSPEESHDKTLTKPTGSAADTH